MTAAVASNASVQIGIYGVSYVMLHHGGMHCLVLIIIALGPLTTVQHGKSWDDLHGLSPCSCRIG